jgi:DNA-binding beta-propeller fold protein YncE
MLKREGVGMRKALAAALFVFMMSLGFGAAHADNIFVTNQGQGNGTIGEYTTSGATVNASLVTGLSNSYGIAVSGSDLFVTNVTGANSGTVGEYTTSGATVNASLISGLNEPVGIAIESTVPIPAGILLLAPSLAGLAVLKRKYIG